jgi:hypothetical protein
MRIPESQRLDAPRSQKLFPFREKVKPRKLAFSHAFAAMASTLDRAFLALRTSPASIFRGPGPALLEWPLSRRARNAALRAHALQPLHPGHQIALSRLGQKMVMVVHEHAGMDAPAGLRVRLVLV